MRISHIVVAAAVFASVVQAKAADPIRIAYQTPPSPSQVAIVDGAYENEGCIYGPRWNLRELNLRIRMQHCASNRPCQAPLPLTFALGQYVGWYI